MNYKSQAGFSMIDMVIGIMILAFVLPGILFMIGDLNVKSVRNETIEKATTFANTVMHDIRVHRFDENYNVTGSPWTYPLGQDGGDYDDIDDFIGADWSGVPGYSSAGYQATSTIHYVDPLDMLNSCTYQTDFKRIIVTVNHAYLPNSIILTTIMTPHGN